MIIKMTKRTCLCLLVLSGIWTSASAQYSKVQPEVNTYTYASKDGEDLQLDVYIDPTFSGTENRPVMIFSYGGAWEGGKMEDGKAFLEEFAQDLFQILIIFPFFDLSKMRPVLFGAGHLQFFPVQPLIDR